MPLSRPLLSCSFLFNIVFYVLANLQANVGKNKRKSNHVGVLFTPSSLGMLYETGKAVGFANIELKFGV